MKYYDTMDYRWSKSLSVANALSAVACGGHERLEELSVMMKSAIIFSQSKPLKFLIFTDNLALEIEKLLDFWKPYFKKGLSWDIRPVLYPPLSKVRMKIFFSSNYCKM